MLDVIFQGKISSFVFKKKKKKGRKKNKKHDIPYKFHHIQIFFSSLNIKGNDQQVSSLS